MKRIMVNLDPFDAQCLVWIAENWPKLTFGEADKHFPNQRLSEIIATLTSARCAALGIKEALEQPRPQSVDTSISAERTRLAIERVRQEIATYENAQHGVLDSPSLDFLEDLKILSDKANTN